MSRLAAGDRLAGRYEIRALTADRPTGLMYRGFDEQIGVDVALRVIDDELLSNADERSTFAQRARRGKALQHPSLIRLYDVLVDDAAVCLVMQWAPGVRLSKRGEVSIEEARTIIRRVAAGASYANQHGVVLGNLRADTVILYEDGLKLTNVGIGPALPRDKFLTAMASRGALDELAPELRYGGELDERTDVYGVARLARQLLGDHPVWEHALLADPTQRPRDVDALLREIDAALDERPPGRVCTIVPTGADTERVEKMEPIGVQRSEPIELDEAIIEEPDVTDVGGRKKRAAPPPVPPPLPIDPTFATHDPESRPKPMPLADDEIPMLPSRPQPASSAKHEDESDEEATNRREKLEPFVAPTLPPPTRMSFSLPLVILCALLLGICAVLAARITQQHAPIIVTQPLAIAAPLPGAAPSPAPEAAAPIPAPAMVEPVVAQHGCALGMAQMSSPHAYCIDQYEYPGGHTIPRTQVSLADAATICASRHARLCTDGEWEAACRGPQQASYPYGQSYDAQRCNSGGRSVLAAGSLPRCRSAAGAYDMSGNVAEWTASGAQRGGSTFGQAADARCSHVARGSSQRADVGFRCCGDVP